MGRRATGSGCDSLGGNAIAPRPGQPHTCSRRLFGHALDRLRSCWMILARVACDGGRCDKRWQERRVVPPITPPVVGAFSQGPLLGCRAKRFLLHLRSNSDYRFRKHRCWPGSTSLAHHPPYFTVRRPSTDLSRGRPASALPVPAAPTPRPSAPVLLEAEAPVDPAAAPVLPPPRCIAGSRATPCVGCQSTLTFLI